MTYRQILDHIYGLGRFGIKPGLERISSLLEALHNPQASFKTIHIAGTNGKGSTACFIASMLDEGGFRVGLFTSPHLISFTERIRINGREIAEEDVVRLGQKLISTAPPETTFFEMVTALACLYFAEQQVDLAIMEVGMGGSLDATNALHGVLSVITPVAFDHCEYLGKSLSAIAREKAGIIKAGSPVVMSWQAVEARTEIEAHCRELQSPLYCFGNSFTADWNGKRLNYEGLDIRIKGLLPGLPGRYQLANAASALAAAEILKQMGFSLDLAAMRRGMEKARWPGRMEMFGSSPRILLDGAHNPAGSGALAEALTDIPRRRLLLVAGVMGDKDLEGILGPLLPVVDQVFAVTPALPRALSSSQLASFYRVEGIDTCDAGTVAGGLFSALKAAGADDLVLVCGSLFTVGEARAIILSREFEPFRG